MTASIAFPARIFALFSQLTQSSCATLRLSRNAIIAMLLSAACLGAVAESSVVSGPANAVSFGSVGIGTAAPAQTVTFTFSASSTVGSEVVLTDGAPNLDFTDAGTGTCKTNGSAHTYNAADTCTVIVNFTPALAGLRHGGAVLKDRSGAAIASALVVGTGNGPMLNYQPGAEASIGSGWSEPGHIAVDGAGNVYVADGSSLVKLTVSGNSYVRSVLLNANETIGGFVIDGAGNFFVAAYDGYLHKYVFHGTSHTDTRILSGLNQPSGVAIDPAGNLYVADTYNGRLLKAAPRADGSYSESDILDCGSVGEKGCPVAVAADAAGNLFVSSYDTEAVIQLTPHGNSYDQTKVSTVAAYYSDLAVDGAGNLYMSDLENYQIDHLIFAESGPSQLIVPTKPLRYPLGMGIDAKGNIFISSNGDRDVIRESYWDPPSLSFEKTAVGKISADSPGYVSIYNNGTAPLLIPVPSSKFNPSLTEGYVLNGGVASKCPIVSSTASAPGSVAAGQLCNWGINFKPTATTPSTGTMLLIDNNLNAPVPGYTTQSIALSGLHGEGAKVTMSASATTVTDAQTLTVTVHVAGDGTTVPTGMVNVSSAPGSGVVGVGGLNGSAELDGNGNATVSGPMGNPGTYTLNAYYNGDSLYVGAAASTTIPVTVTQSAPTTMTALYGQSITQRYGEVQPASLCVLLLDAAGHRMDKTVVTFSSAQLTFPNSGSALTTDGVACSQTTPPNKIGTYSATASVVGLSTTVPFTIQVTGGYLDIFMGTPIPQRLYGSPNPGFTYFVDGLQSGDHVTVTPTTTATLTSPVGYYPVSATVSGPDAAKYSVTVYPASLYVHAAQLTITATSFTSIYGQAPVQPTRYTITGFVNGESAAIVSGLPVLTSPVTSTSPVGSYLIHIDDHALSAPNYGFARDPWDGRVHVGPAPLYATANNLVMKRGDPVPPLTYTLTGFVNGETQGSAVTGTPRLITSATSTSRPGVYAISIYLGSLTSHNYSIVKINGTLTVTP